MTVQVSRGRSQDNKSDPYFSSSEQELCVYLIAMGQVVQQVTKKGHMRYLHFDKERARSYILLWRSGKPIPISDIREVFKAYGIWKSAIHDEI